MGLGIHFEFSGTLWVYGYFLGLGVHLGFRGRVELGMQKIDKTYLISTGYFEVVEDRYVNVSGGRYGEQVAQSDPHIDSCVVVHLCRRP